MELFYITRPPGTAFSFSASRLFHSIGSTEVKKESTFKTFVLLVSFCSDNN
jgi:hypothetical protein